MSAMPAPSHSGKKAPLAVRNLGILERRFPKHRAECGAFMLADPLRTARQAIERAAAIPSHPRLLVTGAGAIGAIARERARELTSEAQPVMILEVRHRVEGATVKIFNAAGGMPQSLQFNLSSSRECETLIDFIQNMQPSRIEILDSTNVPFRLVDLLLKLKVPYDIFIADAGLLGPHSEQRFIAAVRSVQPHEYDGRRKVSAKSGAEPEGPDWVARWRKIAEGAQRILVPCPEAEAFAASVLPQRTIAKIERSGARRRRAKRMIEKTTVSHLGLVPVRSCAHEQWLMSEIARRFGTMRPEVAIAVIGAALDDISLMRSSNAFVTGMVTADEFDREVDALGLGYLFVSTTQPLFGHPMLSVALSSSLPTAYFDWSRGRIKPKKRDLPIDPRSSLDDIIGALSRWMPKP